MFWYGNVTEQLKVKQKENLTTERAWMIRTSLSPLLIFAMCKYCKHNVWYWTFIYFSKPLHRIPSHRVRREPHQASWCQPRIYPAAEILSAVSCQPVTTALHWKKYIRGHHPVVLSLSALVNWSAISCIRTSVRRGVVARPFASLTWSRRVFFINSATVRFLKNLIKQHHLDTIWLLKHLPVI